MRGGEGESTRAAKSFMALGGKTQNVSHSLNLGSRHEVFGYRCWQPLISTRNKLDSR